MSDQPRVGATKTPRLLDLLTLTGLPSPLYDNAESPSTRSAQYDSRVGALTHRVLAENMAALRGLAAAQQRKVLRQAADALPVNRNLGRQDKAKFTVDGYCIQYLKHHLPPGDVKFLGGEVTLGTGRVDLLWRTPDAYVFADEIKTSRQPVNDIDTRIQDQIRRYLLAGRSRYGSHFLGIRLLSLGNALGCQWLAPDGQMHPLTEFPSLSLAARDSA